MLTPLISIFCLSLSLSSTQPQTACYKGTEAFFLETGVTEHAKAAQVYVEKKARRLNAPKSLEKAATIAYLAAYKRAVVLETSDIPLVDSLRLEASAQNSRLSFIWLF